MVAVKRRRKAAIVESDSVCHGCKERGNFTQSTSRAKKNNNNFRTQQECCKASYAATFSICNLHFGRQWFFFAATPNAAAANAVIIAALHALATGRGGSSVCVRNSGGGVAIDVKRLRGISCGGFYVAQEGVESG